MADSPRPAVERIAERCRECNWTLTIEEVQRREQERRGREPTAERTRSILGSLGEGHAYFNRGHRVTRTMSPQQIERYIDD